MKTFLSLLAALFVLGAPGLASATTYTWVGPPCEAPNCPGTGTWAIGPWSPVGTPGAGDVVIINGATGTGGTSIGNVSATGLAGLTITGNTSLTDGSMSVTSGTVSIGSGLAMGTEGPMTITLGAGVTTTISSLHVGLESEIDNAGTLTWAAGTIQGDGGGALRNSGTWNMTAGPTSLSYYGGTSNADFYNTGTVTVAGSGNTNDAQGYWGFHNSGVLNFTGGGTLEFQNAGNTLSTLDDGGSITGNGTLLFDQPAAGGPGSNLTLTGTTTVGTGATLAFAPGAQVTIGATGATFAGPGALSWTGGELIGAGANMGPSLTWGSTLAVHMTGSATKEMASAYIISSAPILWDQGNFELDTSYFTNTGTFTASGDLALGNGSYSTFENHGTFVKSTGSGQLAVNGMAFTNYGTINGATGSIVLVTSNNGAPHQLENGSTLQGSIVALCEVSLAGTSTVAASSALEVGNDGTNQGVLDGNGTLGGPGTVKLDGSQINASGTNTITFAAGGNVSLPPNASAAVTNFAIDTGAALTFAGTTTWAGGALEIGNGALVNSGVWTTSAAGAFTVNTSGSTFTNTGTFTADPGTGIVNMSVLVTSQGTVVAKSGLLFFSGYGRPNYTQTAGMTQLAGGNLASGDALIEQGGDAGVGPTDYYGIDIQGGSLTGSGTIDTLVSDEGTVAPGSATAAGTLSITQTYTQSATGILAIGLGGTTAGTGFDVLAVAGDVTIAGYLNTSLIGSYVPAVGSSYKVLTSGGADPDTGMFGTVNDPVGATLTTTYDANDVVLGVSAVNIVPADAGTDSGVDAGVDAHVVSADAGPKEASTKDASKSSDAGTTHGSDGGAHVDASTHSAPSAEAGDGGSASSGSSGGCNTTGNAATGDAWLAAFGLMIALGLRRSRAVRG